MTSFTPFEPNPAGHAASPMPFAVAPGTLVFNVKDYGAKGDRPNDPTGGGSPATLGTDDTGAFNAAIAALGAASTRDNANFYDSGLYARPILYIPAGRYRVGDLDPILFAGFRVLGAGKEATVLYHTGSVSLFTFGTFTTAPANPYVGTGGQYSFENLSMVQVQEWHGNNAGFGVEGSRTRNAITDNFGGNAFLSRVRIMGFRYGLLGQAGSDYNAIENSDIWRCDVGIYLGPYSQQFSISRLNVSNCVEGIVLAGVKQGSVRDCWFTDSKTSDLVFESNTLTRSGVNITSPDDFTVSVENCWFEDNTASTGRYTREKIRFQADNASVPRFVYIRDSYVTAGGTAPFRRAFVRVYQGSRISVERTTVAGNLDAFVETMGAATAPIVSQTDSRTVDGYTPGAKWSRDNGGTITTLPWQGAHYLDRFNAAGLSVDEGAAGYTAARFGVVDDTVPRLTIGADGAMLWGSGTAAADTGLSRVSGTTLGVSGTLRASSPNTAQGAMDIFQAGAGQTARLVAFRRDVVSGGGTLAQIGPWGAFQQAGGAQTRASAGAVTIDASLGNLQLITLQANATSSTITNPVDRQEMTVVWIQDATGGRTYAWPANCKFAGGTAPADTTASKRSSVTFVYDLASTTWYEIARAVVVG